MKQPEVLFICRANVGLSQAAMEPYRQQGGTADSAGARVTVLGQALVTYCPQQQFCM